MEGRDISTERPGKVGLGHIGSVTTTKEISTKYVCITINLPDTKYNPNPSHNPTTKQHAIVNSHVTYTYPETYESMLLHRFYNNFPLT